MVSRFGSLGYTIMGKTADLTVVQKTIIDTHNKEGKPQIFIAKISWLFTECCIQACSQKVEWKEKVCKKNMHNQQREPQLYADCKAKSI